jgi:hypothetical protein
MILRAGAGFNVEFVFHLTGMRQIDKTGQQACSLGGEWVVFQFELKSISETDPERIVPPRALTDCFQVAVRGNPSSSPRQVCLLPVFVQSDPVSRPAAAMNNSVNVHCCHTRALV